MFESFGHESTKQVEIQTFPFSRRENYKIMGKKNCLDIQVVSKQASGEHTVTYMEFESIPFVQLSIRSSCPASGEKIRRKPEIHCFSLQGLSYVGF